MVIGLVLVLTLSSVFEVGAFAELSHPATQTAVPIVKASNVFLSMFCSPHVAHGNDEK